MKNWFNSADARDLLPPYLQLHGLLLTLWFLLLTSRQAWSPPAESGCIARCSARWSSTTSGRADGSIGSPPSALRSMWRSWGRASPSD